MTFPGHSGLSCTPVQSYLEALAVISETLVASSNHFVSAKSCDKADEKIEGSKMSNHILSTTEDCCHYKQVLKYKDLGSELLQFQEF